MYKLTDDYVMCPEKRVIAQIRGNYCEYEIMEEINKYVNDKTCTKIVDSRKYNDMMPLSIYLFPTSDCNLRCKYCYSDAGEVCHYSLTKKQIDSMLIEGAKTAHMVSVAAHKRGLKAPTQEIWFAGGGEPTFEWDIFVYAVEKAKSLAQLYGYLVEFGILTNGNGYTPEKIEYITKNFSFVQVSYDGNREIQNLHRPSYNNIDSFDAVDCFVKALMSANVKFGIRSTVSNISVDRLEEITGFFINEYPLTQYICFEPLSTTDRSKRNNFLAPSVQDFVENFEKAMKLGKKYNVIVATSLLNISQVRDGETFCDCSGGTTTVLQPNGYLTGCTETMMGEMSEYSPFIVGRIMPDGKIEKYRYSSDSIFDIEKKCKHCHFFSFCQGDCPLTRLTNREGHLYRCAIKKNLIKDFLLDMINEANSYLMEYQCFNCNEKHVIKIWCWGDDVMGYKTLNLSEKISKGDSANI